MNLTAEMLLQSIWAALRRIETNMALPPAPLELPTPQVHIGAPDLGEIVTAVTSLKPGPSAEEIAAAIAATLTTAPPNGAEALEQVARALEKLDFRLKGEGGRAFGGGSVTIQPNQTVGISGPVEIANDVGNPLPVSGTVTVANPTAAPETGLAKDATLMRRYGDHVTKAGLANTAGDNTLHTPAAGKKIRLYWIALSSSQDNAAENLIQVKLTDADGAVKYRWRMGNPSAAAFSRTVEGDVDAPLILNLANTQPVDWNVDLEEI